LAVGVDLAPTLGPVAIRAARGARGRIASSNTALSATRRMGAGESCRMTGAPSNSNYAGERGPLLVFTALRVASGAILAVHGWLKFTHIAGTAESFQQIGLPAPHFLVYLAVAGELL